MTILQQEEAKNFFKENDDKKLYQFFQRGSMLDSIEQTNKKTMYEIQLMAENIKVKYIVIIIDTYMNYIHVPNLRYNWKKCVKNLFEN